VVESMFKKTTRLKPDPFFTDAISSRISLGNFEDDFGKLSECDWVVEAVVERMDIKRDIARRIAESVGPNTIVSTNTSGLPIHEIVAGLPDNFRQRFLGTHFFNPPRYLKLLEVVPTDDTDEAVLERIAWFGRVHLGKGIVVAKDRPYFIGNRIGIYAMMAAIQWFEDGRMTIEEIDAITGALTGRPKSATFRTADVVGLDVMRHVIENLRAAVQDIDESADAFTTPASLQALVDAGALGSKTRAGYYRKDGKEIKSIDPATGQYQSAPTPRIDLASIWKAGGLKERLNALYDDDGLAGDFFRTTTRDLLGYSARRIPEITENPADVDRAIRWGFGWDLGPFEIWDALGVERVADDLRADGIHLPEWVGRMLDGGAQRFYTKASGNREVYVPGESAYRSDPDPSDELSLQRIASNSSCVIWQKSEGALLDLGDGVALYEFRSKANALGKEVMEGLEEAIETVENDDRLRGLVIANDGKNFSVGANLMEVATALKAGKADELEHFLSRFQQVVQRVRYAGKPVVPAIHQMALGGGCEIAMASQNTIVCAEAYLGLVELGVGVIPAGTGTTRLAQAAADAAPNGYVSEIQASVNKFFETVAGAKVSRSGPESVELGYLPASTTTVMNTARRFHVARNVVIEQSEAGYLPPPRRRFTVLGRPGAATLEAAAYNYLSGRFISEYDFFLASRLAFVLTGGELTGPQEVDEQYLIDLERKVFLELLQRKETQDRIEHMLKTGKPLRN
ncbi:MAG: 3-hydroxyacyl-CoA dehydrogenase/enoyl-CoA hydratase family protein, partial [Rhodothermia bacterium]|nr:3-hydroxyacyl-CoA dehydrogenase/enoyl-CoA hydratase family protein [Rhodothermia bacterium]